MKHRFTPCAFLGLLLLGHLTSLAARGQELVGDIDPSVYAPYSSTPSQVIDLGSRLLFIANGHPEGVSLWRSDGTQGGTAPLGPRCPEACNEAVWSIAMAGKVLLFGVRSTGGSFSIWRTDGTATGTFRLVTGVPTQGHPWFSQVASLSSGIALFSTAPGANDVASSHLWRSDGSIAGTYVLLPAPAWRGTTTGDQAFFASLTTSGAGEVFTSKGTSASTRRVSALANGSCCPVSVIGAVNGRGIASTYSGTGLALWSLGTSLSQQRQIASVAGAFVVVKATRRFGNRLYITLLDQADGTESLWVTDGTPAGTRRLTFDTLTAIQSPIYATPAGMVLFLTTDLDHGTELWQSDGTVAGTRMAFDFCPGSCSGARSLDGKGQLIADDGVRGAEPYFTNGTLQGTRLIGDFCPGSCGSNLGALSPAPGGWIALANEGAPTQPAAQVLVYLPNGGGPVRRLRSFAGGPGGFLGALVWKVFGDRVVFAAHEPETGVELWQSNFTRPSTKLFADLDPRTSPSSSVPSSLTTLDGHVYLLAMDQAGTGLWRAGDAIEGAELVHRVAAPEPFRPPLREGASSATSTHAFLVRQTFAMTVGDLWATNGTNAELVLSDIQNATLLPAGETMFIVDQHQVSVSRGTAATTERRVQRRGREASGAGAVVLGGQLLFVDADDSSSGLWRIDATLDGATRVFEASEVGEVTTFAGGVLFAAHGHAHDATLWRTDGTPAGTHPVHNFDPLGNGGTPRRLVGTGALVYFVADDPSGTPALFATDGTTVTRLTSLAGAEPYWTAKALGNRLFFIDGDRKLWSSRGTVATTRRSSILPSGEVVERLQVAGGTLWITTAGEQDRPQLWRSNGAANATRVTDGNNWAPGSLVALDEHVYLGLTDEAHGYELWRIPIASAEEAAPRTGPSISHWSSIRH